MNPPEQRSRAAVRAEDITLPAPALIRYYILCSLLAGSIFPIALIALFCKYATLRYRFDESGIAMLWGVLFRKEIYLTHRIPLRLAASLTVLILGELTIIRSLTSGIADA